MSFISTNWRWQAATSPPVTRSFQQKLVVLEIHVSICQGSRLQSGDWSSKTRLRTATQWQGRQPGERGAQSVSSPSPGKAARVHQRTQSLGWRRTSRISASLEFSGGECMYSHRAVRGKDIKMLSILDPGVKRPNFVPRSYSRLNSTYRPLRSCCHSFSWGVNESSWCFFTRGM